MKAKSKSSPLRSVFTTPGIGGPSDMTRSSALIVVSAASAAVIWALFAMVSG